MGKNDEKKKQKRKKTKYKKAIADSKSKKKYRKRIEEKLEKKKRKQKIKEMSSGSSANENDDENQYISDNSVLEFEEDIKIQTKSKASFNKEESKSKDANYSKLENYNPFQQNYKKQQGELKDEHDLHDFNDFDEISHNSELDFDENDYINLQFGAQDPDNDSLEDIAALKPKKKKKKKNDGSSEEIQKTSKAEPKLPTKSRILDEETLEDLKKGIMKENKVSTPLKRLLAAFKSAIHYDESEESTKKPAASHKINKNKKMLEIEDSEVFNNLLTFCFESLPSILLNLVKDNIITDAQNPTSEIAETEETSKTAKKSKKWKKREKLSKKLKNEEIESAINKTKFAKCKFALYSYLTNAHHFLTKVVEHSMIEFVIKNLIILAPVIIQIKVKMDFNLNFIF